ncbi:MAG: hypothetical protein PHF14_01875 [Verrucomicrobiota bacterium]|nr:hypothetical protein [Verrucomicrobiota bacterium]MDD8045191.1 hypothetical protein [Verrucomicrobiota bacterium]MDI9384513.1 hypothetical protein [Verrucomicrobiota bacterium]
MLHPTTSFQRIRYELSGLLGKRESTYIPLLQAYLLVQGRRRPWMQPVGRDTELVMEGFPRSANSFALWAFLQAQARPVRLAHHLHVEAHVLRAVRLGIPTLILIRRPLPAAVSFNVMMPSLEPNRILSRYIRYYSTLEKLKPNLVRCTFEEVTHDFGDVIQRVNEQFGTRFTTFAHTPENLEAVFRQIDRHHKQFYGRGTQILPNVLPRPHEQKTALKEHFQQQYSSPHLHPLLEEAEAVYETFLT